MGYLDSDTTSVDAILTKHGRKKLADGHDLGIKHFALADDGVDYTLYNVSHISGSNYYGSDITGMPLPEAVPDDTIVMKYKLLTRARNTVYQPWLKPKGVAAGNVYTIEDQGSAYAVTLDWETINHAAESCRVIFNDISAVNVSGATGKKIGGNAANFLTQNNLVDSVEYVAKAKQIVLTGKPTSYTRQLTVQLVGEQSGAVQFLTINVNKNIKTLVGAKANSPTAVGG